VQVKIEPGRLHGGQASDGVPGWLTGPLFANLPGGAGDAFERTVISTVHASIFANILARGAHAAAAGRRHDCGRGRLDSAAGIRPSSHGGSPLAPAARGSGCRDGPDRWRAWPVASAVGVPASRPTRCKSAVGDSVPAASPGRAGPPITIATPTHRQSASTVASSALVLARATSLRRPYADHLPPSGSIPMSEAGSIPMGVKEKLSGDMESQNPSLVLIWQSTTPRAGNQADPAPRPGDARRLTRC
jgi:hypothetical protein